MLGSGIPLVSEYRELETDPDFCRLHEFSRTFRASIASAKGPSRRYGVRWVDDPFLQWSRRWEYVYVAQRLEDWWKRNPDALDVADAGSGFTFFPFYLQQRKPDCRICCIDSDPVAGRAIDAASHDIGGGPSFSLNDLEDLDRESESLDAVYSVSVIEHTANPQDVVAEIHRILRKGGIFVCTFDVSFEPRSPMYLTRVDKLVTRLQETFVIQDTKQPGSIGDAERPDVVTTTWISKTFPERLPWRFPRLVWFYDLLRGRFRTGLYRPMTFYCGTYIKS